MDSRVLTVSVGTFEPFTRAMGPGKRACLWVRGCSIRCPGCATPEFIPREPQERVAVVEICEMIVRAVHKHALEGMSFSGGEPFEQAEALSEIARFARAQGLGTLSWSGYTRRHLEGPRAPRGSQAFLAALDVLIDGPFIRAQVQTDVPLRGSANQVLHLLTDRYREEDFREAVIETALLPEQIILTGVTDVEEVDACLALCGVT